MSAAGSRSTMNTVFEFGRRFSWVIWPSTQTMPSLSIQPATRMATAANRERVVRGLSRRSSAHLADARVILLASRVWNGARALVDSS